MHYSVSLTFTCTQVGAKESILSKHPSHTLMIIYYTHIRADFCVFAYTEHIKKIPVRNYP